MSARGEIVEWIFYIFYSRAQTCTPAVPFRAVRLFDSFLEKNQVADKDLKFYALVSLWISLKYSDEERYFYWKDILEHCGREKSFFFREEKYMFFSCMNSLFEKTVVDCNLFRVEKIGEEMLKKLILCGEAIVILSPGKTQEEIANVLYKYCDFMAKLAKNGKSDPTPPEFRKINKLYQKMKKYCGYIKTNKIQTFNI